MSSVKQPEPRKRFPLWKFLLPAAGVLAAAAAVYLVWLKPPAPAQPAPETAVRTAKITAATFLRTLRVVGQTSARNFTNITVPLVRAPDSRSGMVLLKLAKPGTMIQKDEVLAEIDAQSLKDHIDDTEDSVEQATNDIKKRMAEQAVDWESLQQTLRVAKANWDKAQLDLKGAEVKTEIERELYRLRVEEAEANYKQLQADVGATKERHRADLRILEISFQRWKVHLDNHVHDLQRFNIRVPMRGLVVMQQVQRSGEAGQIQEGDQVNPGQAIAKVVDTSSMQVDAFINQAENIDLRVGQRAVVGFDAFPGLQLAGRVHSMGALAVRPGFRENFYIRTVPVRVAIEGADTRIIPDLSAWGDIEIERRENALLVPLEAVTAEGGRAVVYVKRGASFQQRAIELGPRNQTHAVVQAGLQAGDEVALERPPTAP
ncbi:MAG: HlyD family efflux transporter periplasmic adaptor subunit [Acidobacteriota bacterium]